MYPEGLEKGAYDLPHVVVHSPTGFEIGYAGSGPADLALSILADLLEEKLPADEMIHDSRTLDASRAYLHHQAVKFQFLSALDGRVDVHTVSGDEILAFIGGHEQPCPECQGQGIDVFIAAQGGSLPCPVCGGRKVVRS